MNKLVKIFCVTFAAIALGSCSSNAEVHFLNISFADAKALAAKEHKTVMVDFYTSWCGWCKTLDKNTYTDANVAKITDAKFIALKLDAEKGEGIALAKQYHVSGYPTIVFFDKTGAEVDRVVGYEDPGKFAKSLESAAAGGQKAILDDVESAHPTKDAGKWLVAANYYAQQSQRDKSLAAFKKVLELDPDNKKGGNAEATYAVGFLSTGDEQWKTLGEALQKYPDEVDADQANMLLIRHDFDLNDTNMAAHRIDQYAMSHPRDGGSFNYFAWAAAKHKALLKQADDYSKRAILLASSPQEKAEAMDIHAQVVFETGNGSDASKMVSDALALLDPVKDKKLYTELSNQKAQFDKANGPSTATSANH